MTRLTAELAALPGLPKDETGPVFAAPWQAQAFALAVSLHGRGLFTWGEWAQELGAALTRDPPADPSDAIATQEAYWRAWLATLESLAISKAGLAACALADRAAAWDAAARATPHGQPIVLGI